MCPLLATVSLLLYAVTSQAAPMVNSLNRSSTESTPQVSNQTATAAQIPNPSAEPPSSPQPTHSQPAATSAPTQVHYQPPPQPSQPPQYWYVCPPPYQLCPPPYYFCPPQQQPCPQPYYFCPPQQQQQQPCPPPQQQQPPPCPPQQPPPCLPQQQPCPLQYLPCPPLPQPYQPPKRFGWRNAFSNLIHYIGQSIAEALVGINVALANSSNSSSSTITFGKQPEKANTSTPGECCSPTPVQGDDQGNKDDGKPATEIPSINVVLTRNRRRRIFGSPAATIMPGAQTQTGTNQFNCFFVGKKIFNLKGFFKMICKPQFNCCTAVANTTVVEST